MTQQTQPKPVHRFAPNMPTKVHFPVGTAIESPSKFKNEDGSSKIDYYYSIVVDEGGGNDVEKSIYASAALHRELQQRGIGPDCYLQITKLVEYGNAGNEITRWQVLNADGTERPAVEVAPQAAPAAPSAPQTAPAAPRPQGAAIAAPGSRDAALPPRRAVGHAAKWSVAQAEKIYTDQGFEIERKVEPHEIQALAATMFIQLARSTDLSLLLPVEQAAAPDPQPPPPQPQPQQQAAPQQEPSQQQSGGGGGTASYDDDLPFAPAF